MNSKLSGIIILIGFLFLLAPNFAQATILDFYVDKSYDNIGREKVSALLYKIGENAYFFVEMDYYEKLNEIKKTEFSRILNDLSLEFDTVIYPKVTQVLGSEWKPGIDGDDKITVLLTQIKGTNGGYFNGGNEYPVSQVPNSNEKEMIYLNAEYVFDEKNIKAYLAHEMVHLITFNQKERMYGVSEDTWLNELRAEVIPSILGYYDEYQGSILQDRVKDFVQKPDDSLCEWKNTGADYGVISLFGQYLLEHYGEKVLRDSLTSSKTGIDSLNYALAKWGYQKDFADIFSDWLVATYVNDCGLGNLYCYSRDSLSNLRVIPQLNYLPSVGESTLTVTDYVKDWSGSWIRFIGGKGTLKVDFVGNEAIKYKLPYVSQDNNGNYELHFMDLGNYQRGTVYISDFGEKYNSLTILPSVNQKTTGFGGSEPYYQFIWSASIINDNNDQEEELIEQLLIQIEYLKSEIAKVQAKINAILSGNSVSCQSFNNDLYYGMTDNAQVRCLQQFLKDQGTDIYPSGMVTGNYLELTVEAVSRFQEKYRAEILTPLGLEQGTGFFGQRTRQVANNLIPK